MASNATRLGIVGGLGPVAGRYYQRRLSGGAASNGTDIIVADADLRTVLHLAQAGDRSQLAAYLNGMLRSLAHQGCAIAAISAVTPHICIDALTAIAPLPLVDLLTAVRAAIEERGAKVALFGTRVVIESDLFGSLGGVRVVRPAGREVEEIDSLYRMVAREGGGAEERQRFTAIARSIVDREKLDAVVLAGTDLSALFEGHPLGFPAIDAAEAHIGAIRKAWASA